MTLDKHINFLIAPLVIIVFSIVLNSCAELDDGFDDDDSGVERVILLDYEQVHNYPASFINTFLQISDLDLPLEQVKYNVMVYDVTYRTRYKGIEVEASGRVFVPDASEPVPTLCFSHGTIVAEREAMTNLDANASTSILLSGMSSMGAVIVAPDLIGFGASSEFTHPYLIDQPTSRASIDNLRAVRELMIELGLEMSSDLYLGGYSQGGYSTMSIHKAIEESGIAFYDLKKSFPAAGPYDLNKAIDLLVSLETFTQPYYFAYIAYAYADYYEMDQDDLLFSLFNASYAGQFSELFDGSLSGAQINQHLNDTLALFLDSAYYAQPRADAFFEINSELQANSLLDWRPSIPMHLYHGDADLNVPYELGTATYDYFISEGSTVVGFTTLEGATHASGVSLYVEQVMWELNNLINE